MTGSSVRPLFPLILMLLTCPVACESRSLSGQPAASSRPIVVTTLSVLADLIRQVGGDKVQVQALVPPGGEVHTYQPTPEDIRAIAQARIVFYNGVRLEEWIDDTIRSAGKSNLQIVVLSQGLPTVGEPGNDANPHLWLDVANAKAYVEKIRDNMTQADPANAQFYGERAKVYLAQLDELDAWIRTEVDKIPPARRKLITFHDAFPYFARRYGFTLQGVVVASPGKEPSARELSELVRRIKREQVPAVFGESQFSPKLIEILARDAGVSVVTNLYTDSLSEGAEANSYIALMRYNVTQIVNALR